MRREPRGAYPRRLAATATIEQGWPVPVGTTEQSTGSESATVNDFGANEWLVEDMYERYQADPDSVDAAWHDFFADYQPGPAVPSSGAPAASAPSDGGPTASSTPAPPASAAPATAVPATPAIARSLQDIEPGGTGNGLAKTQATPAQADAPTAVSPARPAAEPDRPPVSRRPRCAERPPGSCRTWSCR